jgi:hypothetical protein
VVDANKDMSENFAHLMGYNSKEFTELLRLYLVIHADHEGTVRLRAGRSPTPALPLLSLLLGHEYVHGNGVLSLMVKP